MRLHDNHKQDYDAIQEFLYGYLTYKQEQNIN